MAIRLTWAYRRFLDSGFRRNDERRIGGGCRWPEPSSGPGRAGQIPGLGRFSHPSPVPFEESWIPAFAGMTVRVAPGTLLLPHGEGWRPGLLTQ